MFDVMAERNKFLNFAKSFMGKIQTIFDTGWWWWCAKLSGFAKIQKRHNLESDLICQLFLSTI
jgi:hypothetical protein